MNLKSNNLINLKVPKKPIQRSERYVNGKTEMPVYKVVKKH